MPSTADEAALEKPPEPTAENTGSRLRRLPAPGVGALFTVAIAIGAWLTQLSPLHDNSFLLHLKTGHWILGHGIPHHDIYSFTVPGHEWVAQSWLAEVGYAAADRVAGAAGIKMLNGLLAAAIAILAYRLALRLTRHAARAAFLTAASVGASFPFWESRPLVFGVLLLVVLLWIVEVPGSVLGRRALITVPLVLWAWANLHGTFVLGFGYLLLHLLGRRADGHPLRAGRERALAFGGLLGFALCFVNPYGYRLVLFPFELAGRGGMLQRVVEWMPPNLRTPPGVLFAVWLVAFLAIMFLARRRPTRADALVALVFLVLALWAQRNIALAPLVVLPIVARLSAVSELRDRGRVLNTALIAVLVLLGGRAGLSMLGGPGYELTTAYPTKAMRAVQENGLLGRRLLTTDTWAAYVVHAYWPRQRVFIDDRYDMYPVGVTEDYLRLLDGAPDWQEILDRHRVEVVVWPRPAPLSRYLGAAPGWRRVAENPVAVVYARR
ncbi:hypothetical protein [Actinomadura macrotermitis]|uniref:Glycosyltransferase RgtA/B/C/D-like domain-containing protein n=1 Tax=Actinomadura macrotermitis TaxID=2585200 RepID=A0A7K0BRN2_9ACTN|nr:hypothetical protein [Actinomadura macrotermitis]MQY03850.1 hypothetical protein [Actinomadura macrotermitis]